MHKQESGTLETKPVQFLFQYHITPRALTGESQLFMGRPLRSRLSVIHPNLERKAESAQIWQKIQHNSGAKPQ